MSDAISISAINRTPPPLNQGLRRAARSLSCEALTRYHGDLTAGSLKIAESRVVADLLLKNASPSEWREAIVDHNVLQARSPATARRLVQLIRGRLETMDATLWTLIRDGSKETATHATFAAAIKKSPLLGDFLDLTVREQFRRFSEALANTDWDAYIEGCRERDSEMPDWSDSTIHRLRSSVFQILAQAGYLEDTRSLRLQAVHVSPEVLSYLRDHEEGYVLRCITVSP